MNRRSLVAALLLALPAVPALAQASAPPNTGDTLKDTSFVKPPAGARVAIVEFEDLECPACAHAFPIVHDAVSHYHIPLVRHDFPLNMHIWSRDAAITARYIQDTISPDAAEEFRRAVFASQTNIQSKDDLQAFTRKYFAAHGRSVPFVIDPAGQFNREIQTDYELGLRLGLIHTPTILVATAGKGWVQVTDVSQLYNTIDTAIAQTGGPAPAPASKLHRVATH